MHVAAGISASVGHAPGSIPCSYGRMRSINYLLQAKLQHFMISISRSIVEITEAELQEQSQFVLCQSLGDKDFHAASSYVAEHRMQMD